MNYENNARMIPIDKVIANHILQNLKIIFMIFDVLPLKKFGEVQIIMRGINKIHQTTIGIANNTFSMYRSLKYQASVQKDESIF